MRWAGNEPPMQDPLSPARKFPLRDSEWLPYVLSTDRKLSRNPNPNRTEQFNSLIPSVDGCRFKIRIREEWLTGRSEHSHRLRCCTCYDHADAWS